MNAKETRILIINIQEQHCRGCEYLFGSYQHCIKNFECGKEVYQLGKHLSGEENVRAKRQFKKESATKITVTL
ncbi:hypothetical protein [Bacillus toyonensis]|uniref:hypothetical protein n=1 Tax=Bacillus toyonensis TaxID=155322 RepID=UPI000BFDB1A9|nr:hypothetical protein [Bacillus toyonensis]PHG57745.1 hypothetical protein COI59_29210 [Bacillus toyonensis]